MDFVAAVPLAAVVAPVVVFGAVGILSVRKVTSRGGRVRFTGVLVPSEDNDEPAMDTSDSSSLSTCCFAFTFAFRSLKDETPKWSKTVASYS